MKIQPYIEKLENSEIYKKFQEENKDSFLVAGFFVLDFENGMNIHQIDYYIPSQKKVAAFSLDNNVELKILETMNDKVPEKLNIQTQVDLDALKGILQDEMKNRNITEEIKKIIAIIQTLEGKKVWVLNCILSGMEILKAHIEDESKTVLSMKKTSIMDYIKKVPGKNALSQKALSKEDISKQIEQLDKVKKQLEVEKEKIPSNNE